MVTINPEYAQELKLLTAYEAHGSTFIEDGSSLRDRERALVQLRRQVFVHLGRYEERTSGITQRDVRDTHWEYFGACTDGAERLFADDGTETRLLARKCEVLARRLCRSCVFLERCLTTELALGEKSQWGFRGGMTARERRKLIREIIARQSEDRSDPHKVQRRPLIY